MLLFELLLVSSPNEAGSSFHTFAPILEKAFSCISNLDFFLYKTYLMLKIGYCKCEFCSYS